MYQNYNSKPLLFKEIKNLFLYVLYVFNITQKQVWPNNETKKDLRYTQALLDVCVCYCPLSLLLLYVCKDYCSSYSSYEAHSSHIDDHFTIT